MCMLGKERALILLEIMIGKCINDEVEYNVNIEDVGSKFHTYTLNISAVSSYDFLGSNIDFRIVFSFDNENDKPYVTLSYTDTWDTLLKINSIKEVNKYKDVINDLYEASFNKNFDEILERSKEYFDINNSEIRDIKINKIIEDE